MPRSRVLGRERAVGNILPDVLADGRLQGGMFSIPCTTDTAVTLTFGQAAFQIDPRDMLFQPMTNDLTGQCISSLSAGNIVDDQTWLLGGQSTHSGCPVTC